MPVYILLFSALYFLTACVNQFANMPDAQKTYDPIEYAEQYVSASEKGLINPVAFLGGKEKGEYHIRYYKPWCVEEQYGPQYLISELKKVCQMNGGEPRVNWCVKENTDIPLFKMEVWWGRMSCSTSQSIAIEIITPKPTVAVTDEAWQAVALANGFKTANQIQQQNQAAESAHQAEKIRQAQQQKQQMQRQQAEIKKMLSTRGLKICQEGSLGVVTGYVNDFTDEKIQIQVVNYGGDFYTVSGFKPHVTWDYPKNWFICE